MAEIYKFSQLHQYGGVKFEKLCLTSLQNIGEMSCLEPEAIFVFKSYAAQNGVKLPYYIAVAAEILIRKEDSFNAQTLAQLIMQNALIKSDEKPV